jgi:hypothetical protein
MKNFFKLHESIKKQEENDVKEILKKIPKSHGKLIDGFDLTLEPNNTLKGDDGHVGYIFKDKIHIASPWNFSRCHVFLHELAHMVWQEFMTAELKKEWKVICKKMKASKTKLETNAEELFAHAYACSYCLHKASSYYEKISDNFIKNKVPK